MVSRLELFFAPQHARAEEVTPEPLTGFFDIPSADGILKGVKYVQTSFDQRRLTLFRS